jgi:MSHA pilin protein MshA
MESNDMSKATQRGFTLIELVVVIVILGILAAFALPKFMGLEQQARIASLRALEGSLRSSAAMAHSLWMANGGAAINIEGTGITMTNGYPDRVSIQNTLQTGTISNTAVGRFQYDTAAGTFQLNGAPDKTKCFVTYTNAAALNRSPTIAVTNTAGC